MYHVSVPSEAVRMVRYCPGSASGSPGWVSREEAETYLARDTYVLTRLAAIHSAGPGPVVMPHTGLCHPGCPHHPDADFRTKSVFAS